VRRLVDVVVTERAPASRAPVGTTAEPSGGAAPGMKGVDIGELHK
jgi:hypothetical protein